MHWIVPTPDVAYLLDADVEAARKRKPEYPVDFMHKCRRWYYQLASLLGTMTIIPPLPLEEAKQAVVQAFEDKLITEGGQMQRLWIRRCRRKAILQLSRAALRRRFSLRPPAQRRALRHFTQRFL